MTDIDILKIISNNLTNKKNSTALSDYDVLCNNIHYLNTALSDYISILSSTQLDVFHSFQKDDLLNENYKSDKDLNAILFIANRIIQNGIVIFRKFSDLTKSDDRKNTTLSNIQEKAKTFRDYNELITASRQFFDSLISDSYQLCLLEPKSINYHVLVSLNSFNKYATESISRTIFNDELRNVLSVLESLPYNQWKNSPITQCQHTTFGSKVDYLKSIQGEYPKTSLTEDLKNIFKFSSEFTHIGYTSTLFTNSNAADVVFSDENGVPYLLSMENFSEIKYELLESACWALISIYTPSILSCLEKTLVQPSFEKFEKKLTSLAAIIQRKIKTRNSKYYFFIKDGLIGSTKDIVLPCICGRINVISPPHESHLFGCKSCGSSFTLIALSGDPKYVFTENGPVKVIGCECPEIEELPTDEREELFKQWLSHMQDKI